MISRSIRSKGRRSSFEHVIEKCERVIGSRNKREGMENGVVEFEIRGMIIII